MSTLYIIATPIGNLEDITIRSIRILGEVDMVLCEDTRVTKKLLNKYDISVPTISYHSHSKISKVEKIFSLLREGKDLALVSDAGTPTISDPGVLLVSQVKEKFGDDVKIVPIPGPSAVIAALSASGMPSSDFLFLGFLPHKKGRETLFKEISESKRTVVFYESPHRILKTLDSLQKHLYKNLEEHLDAERPNERKVVIARELTKIHEEIVSGTPEWLMSYFDNNPDKVRGEFVVIVEGK